MTVSIKPMSAGDGYRYLMRSVVAGDGNRDMFSPLTRYYTQSGNPPGRWLGSGLAGLDDGRGLPAGSTASEQQMFHLFGMGNDPVSGEQLGNRPYRISAGQGRASVAGFDLTFSAPKSVSVWWAVADGHTQQVITEAHEAAMKSCVGLLEREVAATRTGRNGVAQAEVRGLIAAAFDHWDSRAGDPQLHTHLVVANRVQTADGTWRTLDSRALFRSVVAISETYNGLLADEVSMRLGVAWNRRERRHSAVPAWEIADVPAELITEFSQRSAAIELEKNSLVASFRDRHGCEPSSTEVLKLRQQATLRTRPDKQLRPLAEMTEQWRERASTVLGMDAQAWAKGVGADDANRWLRAPDLTNEHSRDLAAVVLRAVEEKRSTWSRWNLHAEAARQLMGSRFVTARDRLDATERVVALAISESVLLTSPELASTPQTLQRADGTSMFAHQYAEKYTSHTLLDAEARLLDAGRDTSAPIVPSGEVEHALASPPPRRRYPLGAGQADAVCAIASSGQVLDVLVGPAGSGKTVTLAGLRAAWEARHGAGSVVGLAPSAAAAEVLAGELGIATENTAKWLAETEREPARLAEIDKYRTLMHRVAVRNPRLARALQQRVGDVSERVDRWRLHPGQLMVIDEASLAGTVTLDRIVTQARDAGAKVLLVGDWAQLSAIDAGGAFALLVNDRDDAPELGAVRRFTQRWERACSRRLRVGDVDVITIYQEHRRVHDGDANTMLDAAYQAWLTDERAGKRSLLIAGDSATVTELNTRARADLVRAGRVHPDGVALAAGGIAGAGDRVVTRKNDRTLSTGRGFVKNGDTWIVTDRGPDGSLRVRRPSGGPRLTLPTAYVAEHVELAYATTAYRAQGATVDSAHAVVTGSSMTREALYVAMTRGRHANTAYVVTDAVGDECDQPRSGQRPNARDVLAAVLGNVGADVAAHEVMRAEQDRAAGIAQLADEYETLAASAQQERWSRLLASSGLTGEQVRDVERSPAYGALTAELRRADASGLPVDRALPGLVAARGLADAEDVAAVLHERVSSWADAQTPRSSGRLIAGLIPAATGVEEHGIRDALDERARLIEQRARAVVEQALAHDETWIRGLGTPPRDPIRRDAWMRAAGTVAAYRDRYSGDHDADRASQPRREDQAAARKALHQAVALSQPPSPSARLEGYQAPTSEHVVEL